MIDAEREGAVSEAEGLHCLGSVGDFPPLIDAHLSCFPALLEEHRGNSLIYLIASLVTCSYTHTLTETQTMSWNEKLCGRVTRLSFAAVEAFFVCHSYSRPSLFSLFLSHTRAHTTGGLCSGTSLCCQWDATLTSTCDSEAALLRRNRLYLLSCCMCAHASVFVFVSEMSPGLLAPSLCTFAYMYILWTCLTTENASQPPDTHTPTAATHTPHTC